MTQAEPAEDDDRADDGDRRSPATTIAAAGAADGRPEARRVSPRASRADIGVDAVGDYGSKTGADDLVGQPLLGDGRQRAVLGQRRDRAR